MAVDSFSFSLFLGIVVSCIGFLILTRKKKFEDEYEYNREEIEFVDEDETDSKGTYTTSDPSQCVDIRFTKHGIGSAEQSPPLTVFELLHQALLNKPASPMLAKEYKNASSNEWQWKYVSRGEFYEAIKCAARAFVALGLQQWESVCIMGFNAPQWFTADLGAIYAGDLACGLYTTNNSGQCKYIVKDCQARIIVLENGKLFAKFLEIYDNDPADMQQVSAIVIWDDEQAVKQYNNNSKKSSLKVITWDEMMREYGSRNVEKSEAVIAARQSRISAGNCCTLIYTSGTTGAPKGVMLSHDNVTWTIKSILQSQKHVAWWGDSAMRHSIVSYLPLSHVAAQALDIYGPLLIGYHGGDGTVYFARSDALKGSLGITLAFAKPTVFLGVPRVWEKIEEKMRQIGKRGNFVVRFISRNAKKIGLRGAYNKQLGGNKEIPWLYNLINSVLFATIKKKLGFQRLQLAITGAAPIQKSTMKYFHSLGISLIEGYGMSESTALITMGLPFYNKIGCNGPPLLGVDCLINDDDDNNNKQDDSSHQHEICVRGRNVMMGYLHSPHKTAETFVLLNSKKKKKQKKKKRMEYLRTGDMGRMEEHSNLLYITGRLKELIITAGGENVAPVPIEDYLKSELGATVSNVVLIGDDRKYLTVLITLNSKEEEEEEDQETDEVKEKEDVWLHADALEVDVHCKTVKQAQQSAVWKAFIEHAIHRYNENKQVCVSRAQRIQYFRILDRDFSERKGEMTSTLKLKRAVIANKFKPVIDSMY